jgi:hypothetical protein
MSSDDQEREIHETDPHQFLIVDNTPTITGPDLAAALARITVLERDVAYLRDANLGLMAAINNAVKDLVAYERAVEAAVDTIRLAGAGRVSSVVRGG